MVDLDKAISYFDNDKDVDVAKEIDSPEPFTAKIMQILTKSGIIHSAKGVGGGFEVSNEAVKSIKLIQIVDAIDGDKIYRGCGIGLKECSEDHPCPVHHEFKKIRGLLLEMLTKTKADHKDLVHSHVWGCPVYVLEAKLQNGKKLPKWN